MKKLLYIMAVLTVFVACHKDEDVKNKQKELCDRTVLIYISGENNLHSEIRKELQEIREGSVGIGNNALVVYVDDADSRHQPYILRLHDGVTVDSTSLESDQYASDPAVLRHILSYTSEQYPAREYGLVLWGHSSGWIFEDSISTGTTNTGTQAPLKAYGIDTGNNNKYSATGKWMNMHTLNKTICEWGHLKFIFADCCQFQCVESAYELRHAADYIIGSPAEIPGYGAPYSTVTKGFFNTSEQFYQMIVDSYFAQSERVTYYIDNWTSISYLSHTPLSVIRTSELEQLATATNTILHTFLPMADDAAWPDLSKEKLIYYRGNITNTLSSLMYDMNDVMRRYADTQSYGIWKTALDHAVIYKANAREGWITANQIKPYVFGQDNYGNATEVILTDERYGGISMFVPQDRPKTWYYPYTSHNINHEGYNASIKNTTWYHAARLWEFGW